MKDVYLRGVAEAGFTDIEVISDAPAASAIRAEGEGWPTDARSISVRAVKPPASRHPLGTLEPRRV